jgi:hypothetical protein
MKKVIIVLIVIFFIASFSFGCKKSVELEPSGKLAEAGTEAYQEEELPDSAPWQDAEYYIGKTITVYGPVVDTKHFGAEGEGTTFLFIGKVYPEPKAFTIWIDDLDRGKFSQDPKTYYYGKSISVTGLILESNGSPYIEVTDPNQINGGEEIAETAPEEEILSIPWIEVKNYIGEIVTVYGPVVATYYDETTDDRTTFINIGKDYPDPEGFSVWIDGINRTNFSEAPEIYYYEKSISATGLVVEIDGIAHMEITDPEQIIVLEEPEDEVVEQAEEEIVEEEVKEEPVKEDLIAPTLRLEIIEGPAFSQLGDNTCYYRIKAYTTGNPSPAISFNKDDSMGSLGKDITQINLHNKGESFTLEATATNSQGTASASITLTHTCQDHIPILVKNDTGGNLSLSISGPGSYSFNIPPGQQTVYVIAGTYNYTAKGCGGAVLSGTYDLSKAGDEWRFWCQ